jgi:hypothetical protein
MARILGSGPQHSGGEDRPHGRERLDDALNAVDRQPQGDDRQHMREPAGGNENRECPKDPTEIDVGPLRDQNGKGDRDGKIGDGNHYIRRDVKPDQFRFPQQAYPARGNIDESSRRSSKPHMLVTRNSNCADDSACRTTN